jgi:hypothetical protein
MNKPYNEAEPDIIIRAFKEFSPRSRVRWIVAVATPLAAPTHYYQYIGAEERVDFDYLAFMMSAIDMDLKSHGFKYFQPIAGPELVERKE